MKFKINETFETVSVEGVEYEVKKGIVELPDNLSPATVGHLVKWHGFTPVVQEEAPSKAPAKAQDAKE